LIQLKVKNMFLIVLMRLLYFFKVNFLNHRLFFSIYLRLSLVG